MKLARDPTRRSFERNKNVSNYYRMKQGSKCKKSKEDPNALENKLYIERVNLSENESRYQNE